MQFRVSVWEQRTGEQCAWTRWKVLVEVVLELARAGQPLKLGAGLEGEVLRVDRSSGAELVEAVEQVTGGLQRAQLQGA